MGDTSETNTKVLSRELFLGVVALKTPIQKNHYLRDKVPFRKSGHTVRDACTTFQKWMATRPQHHVETTGATDETKKNYAVYLSF